MTKKTETKKPLPKLAFRTLDRHELAAVTGGAAACTCGTKSVCHIDGTTDEDAASAEPTVA